MEKKKAVFKMIWLPVMNKLTRKCTNLSLTQNSLLIDALIKNLPVFL
uniref:Uncharacterized protein n=1 Tax=Anguilla anguilla TaxID=7936 RepID=A0A0E9R2R9_ANGAN